MRWAPKTSRAEHDDRTRLGFAALGSSIVASERSNGARTSSQHPSKPMKSGVAEVPRERLQRVHGEIFTLNPRRRAATTSGAVVVTLQVTGARSRSSLERRTARRTRSRAS
jgi:hypothetical protein